MVRVPERLLFGCEIVTEILFFAGTLISVSGLIPQNGLTLFALTSKERCAQALPYGSDDGLLHDVNARHARFGNNVNAYFSTANKNAMHSSWLQRFFVCETPVCTSGGTLKFEVFWSFPTVKSLKQRFIDATNEEEVCHLPQLLCRPAATIFPLSVTIALPPEYPILCRKEGRKRHGNYGRSASAAPMNCTASPGPDLLVTEDFH